MACDLNTNCQFKHDMLQLTITNRHKSSTTNRARAMKLKNECHWENKVNATQPNCSYAMSKMCVFKRVHMIRPYKCCLFNGVFRQGHIYRGCKLQRHAENKTGAQHFQQ